MMARPLTLVMLIAGLGATPVAAQDARPGVAVLAFENGGSYGRDREDYEALRRGIAGMLIGELSRNPNLRLVERSDAQRLLDEQTLGAAGRVDAGTAARLGRMVGARYMITGTFIDLYGEFRLDARVIDVETGEILRSVRSDPQVRDVKQLYQAIQSLAERIVTETNLPALPPTVQAVAREVPTEALSLYSRALLYEDRGDLARAIEYYERALRVFPDFTEAREGLRKARGGGAEG